MIDFNQVTVRTGTGGDGRVQTLSGSITIEEATGRLVVRDAISNKQLQVLDRDGLKTYNGSEQEVVRSGQMPDTSYGFTAAKPGETIQSIYG